MVPIVGANRTFREPGSPDSIGTGHRVHPPSRHRNPDRDFWSF